MRRMWSPTKVLAVFVSMLFLAGCGAQMQQAETGKAPQVAPAVSKIETTWVSCLTPQGDPAAVPESLCPSPAPGQYMLTITDRELTPKIQETIKSRHGDAEVTNVFLTFSEDAFVIQGTLLRPFRTTIMVSGRLVVRNGRIEADMVKGRLGILPVPAGYMAEAAAEVNEMLDTFFRSEYGIRTTHVEIHPGVLLLTGEELP